MLPFILFSRYATDSPRGNPRDLIAIGVRLTARSFAGRSSVFVSG